MRLDLTKEDIEVFRHRASELGYLASSEADVYFEMCPICGKARWVSTQDKGSGDVVICLGERACDTCETMRQRYGELFEYLTYIIQGQRLLTELLDRTKKNKSKEI